MTATSASASWRRKDWLSLRGSVHVLALASWAKTIDMKARAQQICPGAMLTRPMHWCWAPAFCLPAPLCALYLQAQQTHG